MKTIRVGVVGVGHLGSLHAKMLAEIPDADLVGVCDLDQEKAKGVADRLDTKKFDAFGDLLESVDAVTVATTTRSHFELVQQAISAEKHVFVEKPITRTVAEAANLTEAVRKNELILQVGHIERFNPAILALEKYELRPMFVESHRLAQFNPRGTDVAVVLDLMIHDIDIILSFVRSPVSRIDANGVAVVSGNVDIANARIQFENGCVANVTGSRISQRRMRKMRLFQQNEYISIDFSEGAVEVFRLLEGEHASVPGTMMLGELGSGDARKTIVYEQPEVKEVNALRYELELFLKAIREGSAPVIGVEEGRQALEVAQVIMEKIGEQQLPMK